LIVGCAHPVASLSAGIVLLLVLWLVRILGAPRPSSAA
jgi:hypothetical protein